MERILNITIDDVSTMENWEKEALFKTLLIDVGMSYKIADLSVSLYSNTRIYNGNIPQPVMDNLLSKV